jgi:hypothetical protein
MIAFDFTFFKYFLIHLRIFFVTLVLYFISLIKPLLLLHDFRQLLHQHLLI